MQPRVNIITLGVENLEKSKQFYAVGLGWTFSAISNENIIFFQLGGIVLALYSRAALAEDAQREYDDCSCFPGFTLAYNAESEAAVDAVLAKAKAAGAEIVKPGQAVFWGGYSGYFADPDGFLWEVAYNPHFTLARDGSVVLP